jgi:hypothetical protein
MKTTRLITAFVVLATLAVGLVSFASAAPTSGKVSPNQQLCNPLGSVC